MYVSATGELMCMASPNICLRISSFCMYVHIYIYIYVHTCIINDINYKLGDAQHGIQCDRSNKYPQDRPVRIVVVRM